MPKGPATKIQSSKEEKPAEEIPSMLEEPSTPAAEEEGVAKVYLRSVSSSSSRSSMSSSTCSSRRGSSSTDDDDDDETSTGRTTPAANDLSSIPEEQEDVGAKLGAALSALQETDGHEQANNAEPRKTKLARRTGSMEISSEPLDASRLDGPLKMQMNSNALGLDRSLTLSDEVPSQHFSTARGRNTSRRAATAEDYNSGWSYEQNTMKEYSQES
jgi:hypothetical protein